MNDTLGPTRLRSVNRIGPSGISIGVLAMLALLAAEAPAQLQPRMYPSDQHFSAFRPYLDGDFTTAHRDFRTAPRMRSTERVWIDAIADYAMMGECLYHMGDLKTALEHYNDALRVYLTYSDWLLRIQIPELDLSRRRTTIVSPSGVQHGPTT